MKSLNIKSIIVKKYKPYSSSNTNILERSNLINRNFTTSNINQKWATDITYVHTVKHGQCYLASVRDLHSCKIIGYSLSRKMYTDLAISAIKNAVYLQSLKTSVILHSDLGCQYTSSKFKSYIDKIRFSNPPKDVLIIIFLQSHFILHLRKKK